MSAEKNMPFDEDVMTLFMGIEPNEPGQHGETKVPAPDEDAIGTLVEIKDIIEKFLLAIGKGKENADRGDRPKIETDSEEEPMETEEDDEEKRR